MRDIKFRAWFAKEKAMVPVDNLELLGTSGHAEVSAKHDFEKGGWYSPLRESTHRKTVVDGSKDQVPRVVLLQYTGLKDKDGVEIFEGDILEVWQDMEHIPNRDSGGGIVDYDQEEGWVQLGVVGFEGCSFSYKTSKTLQGKHEEIHLPIDWLTNYGVVGNIYENPELLGDSN